MNVNQHVDEVAFTMLGLTPEQREQAFQAAYEHALAKNPDMSEVPPSVIIFVAKVLERIAELEQLPTGTA